MERLNVIQTVNPEIDRLYWGDGPWDGEPDKINWIDGETDLDCMMVRNSRFGSWCGYVGVPPEHKLHKVEHSHIDGEYNVHGGLTFSSLCSPGEPEYGICHVALPGRPKDVWWFGFDCGHVGDLIPGALCKYTPSTYRDHDYVMEEVYKLALQLRSSQ